MHYHCEIILPPTDDIEASVAAVMAEFDENAEERDHAFWDWYVIGGRWAGNKLIASYDKDRISEFYAWLSAENVTVSGLVAGKQELNPPEQASKVDAKWNEMFPSAAQRHCPLFNHSNDQYGQDKSRSTIDGDVMRLGDVPTRLECERVIIAGWCDDARTGPVEAAFMLCESQWNGCNHMKVEWDGTMQSALEQYKEKLANYAERFCAANTPTDDWLVVTVDYHS